MINGREADNAGIPFPFSLLSSQPREDEAALEVVDDYDTVLTGFAVRVPYKHVEAIKGLAGVKNAFVEHVYQVPIDQGSTSLTALAGMFKNSNTLEMVGADSAAFTGEGISVAIIDSGVATAHEAFSGTLDPAKVALSESKVSLVQNLHGKNYTRVSDKIPFAYDYGDGDNEVTPPTSVNEHGTHVAGIAAANGGSEIRGIASDAQIVAMKVSKDYVGSIYDSTILAALEDAVKLDVDVINMSLGSDAGFPQDSDKTYADVYDSVEKYGILLNVAAGNSDSAAASNNSGKGLAYVTDPDDSIVLAPSTYDASLSVASVNALSTTPYLTLPDGAKVFYQPSSVESPSFASLARTVGVYDAGFGHATEYAQDTNSKEELASGKIALIQRGSDQATEQFTF